MICARFTVRTRKVQTEHTPIATLDVERNITRFAEGVRFDETSLDQLRGRHSAPGDRTDPSPFVALDLGRPPEGLQHDVARLDFDPQVERVRAGRRVAPARCPALEVAADDDQARVRRTSTSHSGRIVLRIHNRKNRSRMKKAPLSRSIRSRSRSAPAALCTVDADWSRYVRTNSPL